MPAQTGTTETTLSGVLGQMAAAEVQNAAYKDAGAWIERYEKIAN